jgi:hypothetical protein
VSAAALGALLAAQSAAIGGLLRPGMQLVYESGGVESPWTIDSVTRDTSLGGRTGCVRLRLRTSAGQATSDTRAHCADSATMFTWDERRGELRPARPLRPGATLELPQRDGGSVRFETGPGTTVEQIGALAVEVLPTTVTTRDSAGHVLRRLRERFALGLATATGGVFELPDAAGPNGWRTVRQFALVAIRSP